MNMVWDIWSQSPACETVKSFKGLSPPLLNFPSPKSSEDFLLYSLPHTTFPPFFVLIFRHSLRKYCEKNKKFFLPSCFNGWANFNHQIFQFLYGTSYLTVSSLPYFEKSQNKIGILFLPWNSTTDKDEADYRDKIRETIFKYFFCLNSDTWEWRNWAAHFLK